MEGLFLDWYGIVSGGNECYHMISFVFSPKIYENLKQYIQQNVESKFYLLTDEEF